MEGFTLNEFGIVLRALPSQRRLVHLIKFIYNKKAEKKKKIRKKRPLRVFFLHVLFVCSSEYSHISLNFVAILSYSEHYSSRKINKACFSLVVKTFRNNHLGQFTNRLETNGVCASDYVDLHVLILFVILIYVVSKNPHEP